MLDAPRHLVRDAVARALAEDLGPLGDITAALLPVGAVLTADIVARAPGVLAGAACVDEVFAQLDPTVRISWHVRDGGALDAGDEIATVEGPLRSVLTGERSALNFLCHLSGVASETARYRAAADGAASVCETRKTLPGLRALEKAAVRAGGGVNHRGSLSDMVLVKDNHLAGFRSLGLGIADAVARARAMWPGRGVEVECDRLEQVVEAVAAGADVVMLDNMTPEQARECVSVARSGTRPGTILEVSGGVTLETVGAYAATGVDLISTSAITQSAPALDIALDARPG
ncbi:MAG TPA: carboxylating nicotinate-nucleotide diphosphorylase [Acidimicrobiia bacterium]|nr:carboxylating nicotinate-nucleotide diphosphorylase [Acidimicrobiia bacterium]